MGFVKWLNSKLNPNHNWFDYGWFDRFKNNIKQGVQNVGDFVSNSVGDWTNQVGSFVNSITGAHLTGSQLEANEMQMQNQEDVYQRQVTGMQKAGINPALMYQSGTSSAPGLQGSQGTGSMSEIMQALLLDRQAKLLESQTKNTDADTDKKRSETEHMNIVNKYLPSVTETQIEDVLASIGVKNTQIQKMIEEIDVLELDKSIKEIDAIIRQAEADHASDFYKWRVELQKAQTKESKDHAAEMAVKAAMDRIEKDFMEKNGAKMGSSSLIAIAACIANAFGTDFSDIADFLKTSPFVGLFREYQKMFGRSEEPAGSAHGGGGR